jgi:hypothetical protein
VTPPDPDGLPVTLPAAQARQAADLLGMAGAVISAARARSLRGDAITLAGLEQLAALVTGGSDAGELAARLEAAQREMAAAILAGQAA